MKRDTQPPKAIVITGGTDGIGRHLGLSCLSRGDIVVIVGRNRGKGAAFLTAAADLGAGHRASFIEADLSLLEETHSVIEQLRASHTSIDALVMGARHYRSDRVVTPEGFEDNFALFYLSRFILSHGLLDLLERGTAPVIVNIAAPRGDLLASQNPEMPVSVSDQPSARSPQAPSNDDAAQDSGVHWDDFQLEANYHGLEALQQAGLLNDLLGVAFIERHPGVRTRYVLVHPGVTSTGFSGQYDSEMIEQLAALKASAKPVENAVAPIVSIIDTPPAALLSAFVEGRRVSIEHSTFDRADALRLHSATEKLLER